MSESLYFKSLQPCNYLCFYGGMIDQLLGLNIFLKIWGNIAMVTACSNVLQKLE